MIKLSTITLLALAGSLMLVGCGGTSTTDTSTETTSSSSTTNENTTSSPVVQLTQDEVESHSLGSASQIDARIEVPQDTSTNLYLLLSNKDSASESVTIESSYAKESTPLAKAFAKRLEAEAKEGIRPTPSSIQEDNHRAIEHLLKRERAEKVTATPLVQKEVGDSTSFSMNTTGSVTTEATLRYQVAKVQTEWGEKTLNVWVSNDAFEGEDCTKSKCVTEDMVEAFAQTFLADGSDNDIYDWVTNIFGAEWGAEANGYSDLIPESDEITILLTDIDNDDNPSGGTIGYFWSKDNFTKDSIAGSNEQIMFYADSVMFANEEEGDYWQKEMYSTLAHEFQHMIHFYQKSVVLGKSDDVWINEMLSETVEDAIATKIEHTGPRGVDYTDGSAGSPENSDGRYPLFNAYNYLSLTTWSNSLTDYSKVNAFGTFLIRNYGGVEVLHNILYSQKEHSDAVEEATGRSFETLLKEWGEAVMLSDHTDLPEGVPSYNRGAFIEDTYNGITYALGSINFYNYVWLDREGSVLQEGPYFSSPSEVVNQTSNRYYLIGTNVDKDVSLELSLNGLTEATVLAK